MKTLAPSDLRFLRAFESCTLTPADLRHRAHLRLAFIYLSLYPFDLALANLRARLQQFLLHHGASPSVYHETITRAWLLAVQHFMQSAEPVADSGEFVAANPRLLDKEIMGSHYTREVLMSEEARVRFIEPDRAPIPREIGNCSGR
jgi:hypothetical protein